MLVSEFHKWNSHETLENPEKLLRSDILELIHCQST